MVILHVIIYIIAQMQEIPFEVTVTYEVCILTILAAFWDYGYSSAQPNRWVQRDVFI